MSCKDDITLVTTLYDEQDEVGERWSPQRDNPTPRAVYNEHFLRIACKYCLFYFVWLIVKLTCSVLRRTNCWRDKSLH